MIVSGEQLQPHKYLPARILVRTIPVLYTIHRRAENFFFSFSNIPLLDASSNSTGKQISAGFLQEERKATVL